MLSSLLDRRGHGWRVVFTCFVAAVFTWGLGVFGAGVYLSEVTKARGWSVSIVSSGITIFYLTAAVLLPFVGAAILDPTTNQYIGRGAAANVGGGPAPLSADEQSVMTRGQTIYSETCFACHGDDGRGAVLPGAPAGVTRAPSLVGSARVKVDSPMLCGFSGLTRLPQSKCGRAFGTERRLTPTATIGR